ncbi:MAG TPA: hypothetical protein VGB77_22935 [Abditibacteriaceae bacterium]|jgi:hypothetical protein
MARLEGERKSPLPVVIGIALLALVAIGGYYAYQNRGADAVSMAPGEVNVVDNTPGNMATNGGIDANREGNTVTIGSDADSNGNEEANKATSPNETSSGEASGSETPTSASARTGEEESGASSAPTSDATTAGTSAATTDEKAGEGVIAERSKTIKNDKAKTTVTYQKKIHQDGSVSHSKATGAPGATPAAQ